MYSVMSLAMRASSARIQTLALTLGDQVPFGVDQHQRRPGMGVVGVPDGLVGVVDDGVADLVAEDGFTDGLGTLFLVELGGVDADDNDLLGVLLLQIGEVGQRVDAVDAAERPEIEDHDLAAEVLEFERAGRVEPGDAAVQFGGGGPGPRSGRLVGVIPRQPEILVEPGDAAQFSGRRLGALLERLVGAEMDARENRQTGGDGGQQGGKEPARQTPTVGGTCDGGGGRGLGHQGASFAWGTAGAGQGLGCRPSRRGHAIL